MDFLARTVTTRVLTTLVVTFSGAAFIVYNSIQHQITTENFKINQLNEKLDGIAVDSLGDQLDISAEENIEAGTSVPEFLEENIGDPELIATLVGNLINLECISGETLEFDGFVWGCGSLPEPSILGASTQISAGEGLWNSGDDENQIWNIGVDNSTVQMLNNFVTVKNSGITATKISDGAITSSKIEASAVTFDHIDGSSCSADDFIKWDGTQWVCEGIAGGGVTEGEVEDFIFDADNSGTLSSGTIALDSISFTGDLNDAQINDVLTIAAGGSVADGALSANVTLLGPTITKDELTGTGLLGFTWDVNELDASVIEEGEDISLLNNDAGYLTSIGLIDKDGLNNAGTLSFDWIDSEVADNLTISAGGSVADGALSGNVTLLGPTITKDELTGTGVLGFTWDAAELDSTVVVEGENISLLNNDAGYITSIGAIDKDDLGTTGTLAFDWADSEVADDLTISAAGSIDDGALSSNVSLLGAGISKDELIDSGVLGFSWNDAEISDAINISALGSVDDGALSANVTQLGATITKDEITGTGTLGFTWSTSELISTVIVEGENISLLNNDAGYLTSIGSIDKDDLGETGTLGFDWADSEVADDLTISSSGSVDDGALSSNVTLLGTTITKDELTGLGTLAFTWGDAEISDAISISALGSVDDGALSSNVSLLGATISKDELADAGVLGFTWSTSELDSTVVVEGENISLLNNDAGYITNDTSVTKSDLVNSGVLPFTWNDSEINDAITISATGSVADGALSSNVTLLGATITKNELTGTGTLGFTWATGELDSTVMVEGENISLLNNDAGYLTSIGSISKTNLADSGTLSFDWVDAEVDDALSISAAGSVADGALSANVSLLGATISKDELVGTGALAFTWSDAEIADDLTISSSGSVDDGALSANVSLLGSDIALDSEVSGNLSLANGGTGGSLADPDSDVILFWDDTGGAVDWLTIGSNVQIVGGTLSSTDEFSGTVTGITAGDGLTGGTINSSGTIAITSETCDSGEKLIWNGSAFVCLGDNDEDTTYLAGNDLTLSGDTFNIESQLDFVSVISQDSGNLTLQTTTSGDILLDPVGNVGIDAPTPGTKLDVNGTVRMTGFNLSTSPTDGYVLTSDGSGNGSWQELSASGAIGTVYSGTSSESDVIIWNGTTTTNGSGLATFNATDDGTGSGAAIFTNVYSIQATAQSDTGTLGLVPLASIRAISGDNKTVTVNVVDSDAIVLGGQGLEFSGSGITVNLTIIGD